MLGNQKLQCEWLHSDILKVCTVSLPMSWLIGWRFFHTNTNTIISSSRIHIPISDLSLAFSFKFGSFKLHTVCTLHKVYWPASLVQRVLGPSAAAIAKVCPLIGRIELMVEEFEQLQPVLLLPFDRFIIQVGVPLAQKQVMKIALKSLVRRRYISASVLENLWEVILQPMPQRFS